ncbi:hypothetical protein [Streptomyces sp. NPDC089915]|uniref:hypothetical protein n=1 Tax=Streptomyces sp. NPDC089915 TaxID=3155186 RepID=UPI0034471B0D
MDSPAENKQSAVLALVLLGVLLIGTVVVFTVFDGEDDAKSGAPRTPTATRGGASAGAGGAAGAPALPSGAADSVPPIVKPEDLAAAHRAMVTYMSGLSTYKHTDTAAAWAPPLLDHTVRNEEMKQLTVLPTGKTWAECQQAKCSSTGKAVVRRDAQIADDLARGSGQTISSVVEVTATRSKEGRNTETETNTWLVSARRSGAEWQVAGFDIYGLGNVGAPEPQGG